MARQHVTVCLSGDGGDEAMAGYARYGQALDRAWMDRLPKAPLRWLDAAWPAYARGHAVIGRLAAGFDERYALTMRTFSPAQLRQALSPELRAHATGLPVVFAEAFAAALRLGPLDRLQYADARSYLPEDILVKVDRTSMACALEVRSPLLDTRFLDLAARIPAQQRLGKAAFRRALRGWLPDLVLDRGKQGFGLPGADWLRGDLAGLLREALGGRRAARRGLLDPRWLRTAAQGGLSRPGLWGQTYAVLMLELWCQAYLDR
jgi:asparagine synthase (glutamine-hydrolysing)